MALRLDAVVCLKVSVKLRVRVTTSVVTLAAAVLELLTMYFAG